MKYLVIDLFGIKLKAFPNKNKSKPTHPDYKIEIPIWVNTSKPKPECNPHQTVEELFNEA